MTGNNQPTLQAMGTMEASIPGRCYQATFRVAAIMTQIAITNGEPLFKVDYIEPDFENFNFDDRNVVDFDEDS